MFFLKLIMEATGKVELEYRLVRNRYKMQAILYKADIRRYNMVVRPEGLHS